MDPKFKEQELKDKITYVTALRYVHSYRNKNGIEPQTTQQNDQVIMTELMEELINRSRLCEPCKEIIAHYDGIRKYWTS